MRILCRGVRELSITPRRAQFVQQVLIQIALHILLLLADLHMVDQNARLDYQTRHIDLALHHFYIFGERRFCICQIDQTGED